MKSHFELITSEYHFLQIFLKPYLKVGLTPFPKQPSRDVIQANVHDQSAQATTLYLHPIDVLMKEEGIEYGRYNDDMRIFGNSFEEVISALQMIQEKLLELGRTMMTDAKLVLLDEPGAGVNPTLMLKIIEMIRKLNQERGYTFCIIEHDMDLIADLCEQVVVLAEGKILTEGTMDQVRVNEKVIDAYFGGDLA